MESPNQIITSLLLLYCNFATVVNCNVNIWYARYLIFNAGGNNNPQVENHWSRSRGPLGIHVENCLNYVHWDRNTCLFFLGFYICAFISYKQLCKSIRGGGNRKQAGLMVNNVCCSCRGPTFSLHPHGLPHNLLQLQFSGSRFSLLASLGTCTPMKHIQTSRIILNKKNKFLKVKLKKRAAPEHREWEDKFLLSPSCAQSQPWYQLGLRGNLL